MAEQEPVNVALVTNGAPPDYMAQHWAEIEKELPGSEVRWLRWMPIGSQTDYWSTQEHKLFDNDPKWDEWLDAADVILCYPNTPTRVYQLGPEWGGEQIVSFDRWLRRFAPSAWVAHITDCYPLFRHWEMPNNSCLLFDGRGGSTDVPIERYIRDAAHEADAANCPFVLDLAQDPSGYQGLVAGYVGWYYDPAAFNFSEPAFGWHVRSDTAVYSDRGWVRTLLNSGCLATIGAVAEPFAYGFPRADLIVKALLNGDAWGDAYWNEGIDGDTGAPFGDCTRLALFGSPWWSWDLPHNDPPDPPDDDEPGEPITVPVGGTIRLEQPGTYTVEVLG